MKRGLVIRILQAVYQIFNGFDARYNSGNTVFWDSGRELLGKEANVKPRKRNAQRKREQTWI